MILGAVPASADITNGLVGYWNFDDGSGTTAKDTCNIDGNTCTVYNGTLEGGTLPQWVTGNASGTDALSFNAASSSGPYVAVAKDLLGTGPVTITAWVYPTSTGGGGTGAILADGSFLFGAAGSSSSPVFCASNNFYGNCASAPMTLNLWQFITAERNSSGQITMYVNGAQSNAANQNAGTPSAASSMSIGGDNGSYTFGGSIDDVRIYNRMLNTCEVSSLYTGIPLVVSTPSTPEDLTVTGTSPRQVNLSWTASTDSGSSITGYNIFRNGTQIGNTSATTYQDTTVTSGSSYSYYITAADADCNTSADSSTVAASAVAQTPPSTPTNLSAQGISSSQVQLTWTASANGTSPVAGYDIYRCSGVNCTLPATPTTTSNSATPAFTDSNLNASTSYTYQVAAYDAADNISSASFPSTASTLNPPWYGIISPTRAIDWSKAGVPGGIPSGNWTQCGLTIAPYNGTTAAINNQISGCPPNTYVQLGAGTFNLSGDIVLQNSTEVRGMGANSTFLVFSAMGSCDGLYSQFCLAGSNSYLNGGEQEHASWTAGFAQGTNQITLSNSLGIVAGNTLINLDQQDEGADTGNIWNCTQAICGSFGGGFARTDYTCSSSVSPYVGWCSQQQQVLVTACSPSCNSSSPTVLTISPGLYMNNWRLSQSPGAWWANTTVYQMGVQNLSADLTNTTAGTSTVVIDSCNQCWVRGIRSIYAARNHIYVLQSSHTTIRDNYFYQSTSHQAESYAIELTAASSDNLVENNICQQVTDSCPSNTGGGAGNVAAYNFAVDDVYESAGWFQPSDYEHASGDDFWLREGQDSVGFISDGVHGTHHFTTLFRNWFQGDELAGCGSAGLNTCTGNTTAVNLFAASRYFNVIGNVLGTSGYDTTYNCLANGAFNGISCNQNLSVYYLGPEPTQTPGGTFCANGPCTSMTQLGDPLTINSLLRWGNYDVVNNAVQWNNSEIPSSFVDTTGSPSIYANTVPANHTLPASLIHATKPSWWETCPWPAIGPDVTGGNITAGSGPASNLGGHVYMNPAMNCFINVMGGPSSGIGNALPFDANTCYVSSNNSGITYGEVLSGDTKVTLQDAVAVAQYAIGLPVTINVAAAEVDGTSTVTLNDAVLIAQYVVGLITKFPVQS